MQCNGPWRKLDIILKTRRSLYQENKCYTWGKRLTGYVLAGTAGSQALLSAHAHARVYTQLSTLPFPLIQGDFQELPFHTSQVDWEVPQQIRGGELVPGE